MGDKKRNSEHDEKKLPSYRELRALNREKLRNAGEAGRKSLSIKGKEERTQSTKGQSAAAGSTGPSTRSGSATKPATSDDLLSSDDYEVRVVSSLESTSSDAGTIGTSAAIAMEAAREAERKAAEGEDENRKEENQGTYRIPRKQKDAIPVPEASNPFNSPKSSASASLEKKPDPKPNPNTPEAMAEMRRKEEEMHELHQRQQMESNARVRERMAKNAAAVAEKQRRRAIRKAWKNEDHCEFNSMKKDERRGRAPEAENNGAGPSRTDRAGGREGGNAQQGHSRGGGWPKSALKHDDARRPAHNENSGRHGLPLLRSVPLPPPRREEGTGNFRQPLPRDDNRNSRAPPRSNIPPPHRESSPSRRYRNSGRDLNSPPRQADRRDAVPYSRPRHLDEGGRGVPRENLGRGGFRGPSSVREYPRSYQRDAGPSTQARGRPLTPRRDGRQAESSQRPLDERRFENERRFVTDGNNGHGSRYEPYSPKRSFPGRSPAGVRNLHYLYDREGGDMGREATGYRNGTYPESRGLRDVGQVPGTDGHGGVGVNDDPPIRRARKRGRKYELESSDSESEQSTTDSSSESEGAEVSRRRGKKRKKSKRFSLADVQDLLRLVQGGQAAGSGGKGSKSRRRRKKSKRHLPSSGHHLAPPREGLSSQPVPHVQSLLTSSRAMHKRYRANKERRPVGDIKNLERTGRLRAGRSGRRFAEAFEQPRDPARENFSDSEFKVARDVMAGVMRDRGKRLDEMAENVLVQFRMPTWYRGAQPIQDIVNVFADLGNDGFATFIHKLLEMDYKACNVWERDLHLLAMKFRDFGMFHFERVCQEIDSLLREQDVTRAMVLARAARLQLISFLELLETPSMYRYFSKLSTFDALNLARRNDN